MTEWFSLFRGILQEELKRRRGHDHKYSLRRFAKDLGLSAGATSDILNGRIHISNKRAALLLTKIPLPVERRDQMRALMGLPIPRATVQISEQNSFVLTDWIYLAVLHFFDLESSDKSPAQIARRLARKTEDVEEA
nr:hypothetical protein [Bdellovibrionales bacterium]